MRHNSRRVAVFLIALLIAMNTLEVDAFAQVQAPGASIFRRQAELFGQGAEIDLRLIGDKSLRGSIGEVGVDFLELIPGKNRPSEQIPYSLIQALELRRVTFRESDDASTSQARRVLEGLGSGRRIELKTSSNRLRGNIQRAAEDHLELLPIGKAAHIDVDYADIRELKPLKSPPPKTARSGTSGKTMAIIVGLVLTYTVVLPALCSARRGCTP